jgi:hypothetical protein
VLCSGSSETKSWEWFLHRIQDQENPKRWSMSWILIQPSLREAKNSNLVEVQYITWSRLTKKDGTTRVCWEKWHERRMDAQRISHVRETSHLNATSKSQASNKQDPFSLLSTNLVRQQ